MQLNWIGWRSLYRQYADVLRHSWNIRDELVCPARISYEAEFLPAHLEIVETPAHPAPLWAMRAIAALLLLGAGVAAFGRLDIVAVARGKLVPDARVKIVQPAVTGVVRRILVENGTHVTAGELLLELDPTQAAADADKASTVKVDAELAAARSRALLQAQYNDTLPNPALVPDASEPRRREMQIYAIGLYSEYRRKVSSLRAQLLQREAQLTTVHHEVERLKATVPIVREQADRFKLLAATNDVAKDDYLAKEQNALKEEGDLRNAADRLAEIAASIEEQKQEIATSVATFRREQLEVLDKSQQAIAESTDDQQKAVNREHLMKIVAPVAGTVQNLNVHTIGGVVTTAQSLMEIVPEDALEVDARLDNKDIGFVRSGQDVAVKIDAYPYTRFGYLHGKVLSVSNDAVPEGAAGLQFTVRVGLPTGQRIGNERLTAGMQVIAEIRTGQRSVAEYFVSPLAETFGQSMRER